MYTNSLSVPSSHMTAHALGIAAQQIATVAGVIRHRTDVATDAQRLVEEMSLMLDHDILTAPSATWDELRALARKAKLRVKVTPHEVTIEW